MALGWIIGRIQSDFPQIYWHHGATRGYLAFLGFDKSATSGVVVLINRGPRLIEAVRGLSLADEIGFRVLDALHSTN